MICPSCQSENDSLADTCFTCGHVLAGVIKKGTVLGGRYEIQTPLGRGGMGTVYKAFDRELDETVALKTLRPDYANSPELAKRFRTEIKLARRVSHRNVCRIHEYGRDGLMSYIVMEFIDGVDLKRILRERGALAVEEAYEVSIQVARALQAIHEVGIVHRDLKTPNIMRDREGVVRLMDFGIAKQVESSGTTGATATGHVVGTPEYMSPEQARGVKVDARSDIYALGIVIYEMFTGEVPFRGDTPIATILKHLQDPPPLDGPAAARLPGPLRAVLHRALAKEPSERFASAAEMIDALRAARQQSFPGRPTTPGPIPVIMPTVAADLTPPTEALASPRPRPRRQGHAPAPSRPWKAAAVGGLGLGAVAAALVLRFLVPGGGPAPSAAPETPESRLPRPTPATDAGSGDVRVVEPTVPAPAPPTPRDRPVPPPTLAASPVPQRAPAPRAEPAPFREPTPRPTPTPEPSPQYVPTRRPVASPFPSTVPLRPVAPPPSTSAPSVAKGQLQLRVLPWAEVLVDGVSRGTTPMRALDLSPGSYTVRLLHPDYQPLQRRVTIRPGETTRLELDLPLDAVAKDPP